MKKLITLSAFFLVTSLTFGQEQTIPKPQIKAYDASKNYLNLGASFGGSNSLGYTSAGGQITFEKSINELFAIGVDGGFSRGKMELIFLTAKLNIIDFYPHFTVHTLELFGLPQYLDVYMTLGLSVRHLSVVNKELEDLHLKGQGVKLGYGIGAKYQVSPITGFFVEYKRYNSFTMGLSFALNQKK